MADESTNHPENWLKLTPNLEHFDPFEGLTDGLPSEEDLRHIRYGFRIAGENILIKKSIICEVVQNAFIYTIPNMPEWVMGMLNLRGNLVPVINLGQVLHPDMQQESRGRKILLSIDQGERAMAIYIDELPVSMELEEEVAETVPADENAADLIREFTTLAYEIDGNTWHEIDHNGLFRKITSRFNNSEGEQDVAAAEATA